MPGHIPRILLAGRTQTERKRRRAGIRLWDYSITSKTKARYEAAVARILPHLEAQKSLDDLDGILCDWIEWQWSRGESLGVIGDCLSGLHFFWPDLKGQLRQAWRMFKNWRRVESPIRAPPLTAPLAQAFVARAVYEGELATAALIALGFHTLLRTGELWHCASKILNLPPNVG